jgi:WD40 repeat protein
MMSEPSDTQHSSTKSQAAPGTPAQQAAVLIQEQRRRWRLGERALVEAYLQQHPTLQHDAEALLDLVYNEILLREQDGETPRIDEYLERFPAIGAQLRLQFEVDQALDSEDLLQSGCHGRTELDPAIGRAAPVSAGTPSVAGYEILGVLGRGGMGVAYKAWHRTLKRLVALKMLHSGGLADSEELARFRTETETVARLHHPQIVHIYEVGEHEGRPYCALEFVDGGNLAEKLKGTPQPADQAAQLIEGLARAMQYAHLHGVVHRDLKPANVLLNGDGFAKITDFGLAKQLDVDVGQTKSGTILGTPSYMAPEQAAGNKKIGAAADVYSLGAILYEMLTGRPPFRAASVLETLEQVRSADPVPLSRLQPRMPRDLGTICLKCLEKDPARRYASAQELAEELTRFLKREPIQARPLGSAARFGRWCRRNPVLATSLISVAGLLLLLAGGSATGAWWLAQEQRATLANLHRAEQAEQDAHLATQQATDKLWDSYLGQARAIRRGVETGRHFKSLELLASAALIRPDLPLRNEAIACMALADLGHPRSLEGQPAAIEPVFDARLEHYLCTDAQGNLIIRRVADDQECSRLPERWHHVGATRFSPDGRFLALKYYLAAGVARDYRIWDWRLRKMVVQQSCEWPGSCLAFSPDSRFVVIGGRQDGLLRFYDLASGKEVKRLQLDYEAHGLTYHPHGNQLAVVSRQVQILDVHSGKVLATIGQEEWNSATEVAWRSDGRWLVVGCANYCAYVWDMEHNRQQAFLKGHQREIVSVTFSHQGQLVATVGWDNTTRLWDPMSGRQLLQVPGCCASFSADDQRLGYVLGKRAGVFDVVIGAPCRRLHGHPPHPNGPWGLDFSPDGRCLASSSNDGVRLWDTATGSELAHLPLTRNISALFLPGGNGLVTSGSQGLYRWALQHGPQDNHWSVGPPQALPGPTSPLLGRICHDHDGHRLAVVDGLKGAATVLHLDGPAREVSLLHPNLSSLSMSPDGQWVATSTWNGSGIKVWDVAQGKQLHQFPAQSSCVAFSPDGRWLVTGEGNEYRIYRTGSWELAQVALTESMEGGAGMIAFPEDGQMMAVVHANRSVKLIHLATGKEIATLEIDDPQIIGALAFSPDGSLLAAATTVNQSIQLWDLRQIRQKLAEMKLDWDLPGYAQAPRGDGRAFARVTVMLGPLGASR